MYCNTKTDLDVSMVISVLEQLHSPFREIDGVQPSLQRVDVVFPQSFIKRLVDER